MKVDSYINIMNKRCDIDRKIGCYNSTQAIIYTIEDLAIEDDEISHEDFKRICRVGTELIIKSIMR